MILTILSLIFALAVVFLEPVFYIPFGFSIFICIGAILLTNKVSTNSIVFLIVGSIILDLTVKNVVGSYLISFGLYVLLLELGKKVSSEGTILSWIFKLLSLYSSLILLSFMYSSQFSNILLIQNIFPTVITYIVVIIFENILSNFNSDNSLTKLKL